MISRYVRVCILACIAAGCSSDNSVTTPQAEDRPVFTNLYILPSISVIERGESVQYGAVAFDQRGLQMAGTPAVTYRSDAPEVAAISRDGLLTGIAEGTVQIYATVKIGSETRSAALSIRVIDNAAPVTAVLTSGSGGWQPSETHIRVGDTVRWNAAPVSWAGVPQPVIWLLDEQWRETATIDLTNGSATMRFDKAGIFRYCSGGCWDSPDFGVINVH